MATTEIEFIPDFDKLDRDIQDEDFETTVDVGGGGGGSPTPSQRNQQESIVAGGVSKGLLAVGVFTAILSQLKAITGIISAVFGAISRALIPIVEKVADFIRPLISEINRIAAAPEEGRRVIAQQSTAAQLGVLAGGNPVVTGLFSAANLQEQFNIAEEDSIIDNTAEVLSNFITDASRSADQTGENTKQQMKNEVEDARRDKTGASP